MKTAMAQYLLTLAATVVFDLTIAIVVGLVASAILFIGKISNMDITVSAIDEQKLKERGIDFQGDHSGIRVVYLTGPLFFMSVNRLKETLNDLKDISTLIISVRGVPLVDMSGTEALHELCHVLQNKGVRVVFCGVQPKVKNMFVRSGVDALLGEENFFWSADMALRKLGGC
jgi:SulP family sulfate permease